MFTVSRPLVSIWHYGRWCGVSAMSFGPDRRSCCPLRSVRITLELDLFYFILDSVCIVFSGKVTISILYTKSKD